MYHFKLMVGAFPRIRGVSGAVGRSSRADVSKTCRARAAYVTVTGMDMHQDQRVAIAKVQEESRKIVAPHS